MKISIVGAGGSVGSPTAFYLATEKMADELVLIDYKDNLAQQHAFCNKRGIHRDYCWFDRDDNPPGPAGGPGTNWENPPGPVGGPGASPDRR